MKSARFYGPKDLRLEDVPMPSPKPGEILLKIGAALTCGTDFKSYRRGHPVLFPKLPASFGHEMAGTIVEVGEGVRDFRVGMRVVPANSAPCGCCFYCEREEWSLCEDLLFLNGAFSEYALIPARIVEKNLHPIPETLPFEHAAMAEPLACVVHALRRLAPKRGDCLAIIGTGPMSLLLVQVAKRLGLFVGVVGRTRDKLAQMERAGADFWVSALEQEPIPAIRQWANGGRGPDFAIEAVGQPETWEQAVAMVRRGGTVCPFGGCARGAVFRGDTFRLHYDEVALVPVFHHTPPYFREALALLAEGAVNPKLLIIDQKPLAKIGEIFFPDGAENPLKIAVIP